ncbi:MAG: phosphatidylglycerophosphatase, partial [Campylobacterota bacterium]|nr:phosphatidylglycerophosphatase [Campylobacterota bacterium]
EFKDGLFSGRFSTINCHGKEKARRIKEHLNIDEYETIYAYGDSSGDNEMLALAHKSVRY